MNWVKASIKQTIKQILLETQTNAAIATLDTAAGELPTPDELNKAIADANRIQAPNEPSGASGADVNTKLTQLLASLRAANEKIHKLNENTEPNVSQSSNNSGLQTTSDITKNIGAALLSALNLPELTEIVNDITTGNIEETIAKYGKKYFTGTVNILTSIWKEIQKLKKARSRAVKKYRRR